VSNLFNKNDRVKTASGSRVAGRVYIVACSLATAAGGKVCDPKLCAHAAKEYVWVLWPGLQKTYSYHYTELLYDLTAPTAEEGTEKIEIKDNYLEKAKQVIKDAIKPKPPAPELDKEFWRLYHGFDRVKLDRNGRPFLYEVKADERPPLKVEEIDWKKYNGFVRSKTYRKDA